ncbi:MAG: hypothetical protein JKY00_10800 [Roseicyclus sp.]|nr:hypothetical protein [Roseicyclus sp.]
MTVTGPQLSHPQRLLRGVLAALLAITLMSGPVLAQSAVGRSSIEGRTVTLLSDGTWRYDVPIASGAGAACTFMAFEIYFCGDRSDWAVNPGNNPLAQSEFRLNDRSYGALIAESIGVQDGATNELYRRAIIENAARSVGVPSASIPIIEIYDVTLQDTLLETLVYHINIDGLDFVFANSVLLAETYSAQFTSYHIGSAFTSENRAAHASFLASFNIEE